MLVACGICVATGLGVSRCDCMWHNTLFLFGNSGILTPEAMMRFPLFQISPYFRTVFRLCEPFPIYLSPEKISGFHLQKYLMTFSLNSSHISQKFLHFPPVSEKLYFPHFLQFPPVFVRFMCLLPTLCVFPLFWPCIIQYTYWTPLFGNTRHNIYQCKNWLILWHKYSVYSSVWCHCQQLRLA